MYKKALNQLLKKMNEKSNTNDEEKLKILLQKSLLLEKMKHATLVYWAPENRKIPINNKPIKKGKSRFTEEFIKHINYHPEIKANFENSVLAVYGGLRKDMPDYSEDIKYYMNYKAIKEMIEGVIWKYSDGKNSIIRPTYLCSLDFLVEENDNITYETARTVEQFNYLAENELSKWM